VAYLGKLNKETEAIDKSIAELVIYSEGSVSWSEAWNMSAPQRNLLFKTLNNYLRAKAGKPTSEDL